MKRRTDKLYLRNLQIFTQHFSSSVNGQANKQNVGKQTKTAFFVMRTTLGTVTRNAICVRVRTL